MQHAVRHHAKGDWPADAAADSLTLSYDDRHRRRIRLTTDAGADVLLDLPKAIPIADGDGLALADGGWLAVRAAPEPLIEITCATSHELARIAWHLGNRHLPAEVRAESIRIRPDHVIVEMLTGLGAASREIEAPFQPEGGAYDHHHHHDEAARG